MKLSFLTPVHNEQRHLGAMLDSLLSQEDDRWEVVLVDDGSTDKTADVIDRYATRDERIRRAGTGTKIGKVRAFNLAHAASTGDVVAISGGDDVHPPEAVGRRLQALAPYVHRSAVAFFKLRMFSDDSAFKDIVIPRGRHGSRSGPSLTLTRGLAERLFPIPESLVSEDIWLGEAAGDLAEVVVEAPAVIVNYRVHEGNSNPRRKPFPAMSAAMHDRARAWEALVEREDLGLSDAKRVNLTAKIRAEECRVARRPFSVLAVRDLPVVDRLGVASMSTPALWAVRQRFYRLLSGWRRA